MSLNSASHHSNLSSDLIITAVANENYFKFIKILAKSLYVSNPDMPIHIRLVDMNSSYTQELFDVNPNAIITLDCSNHNSTKNRFPIPDSKWDWDDESRQTFHPKLVSDKMCHCVQVKYKDISQLLDEGYNRIFSVDSDTIIRKSLKGLIDVIDDFDITIMDNITRDSMKYSRDRAGWKEGAIGVRNTSDTKEFFKKVNEFIDSYGPSHPAGWVVEDKALSFACSHVPIKRGHLPKTYKDEKCVAESCIWSGTGMTKFKSQTYGVEMKKYE